MPFLRFSRDKRGYEHIYLIHTATRRGKPARSRILYWYRTPPGVRVGRQPFDAGVRQMLEAQYPDITFDWETLANTPVPPPREGEQWRERRQAERAAKQSKRDAEHDEPGSPDELAEKKAIQAETIAPPDSVLPSEEQASPEPGAVDASTQALGEAQAHKRRRRGRRRRHRDENQPDSSADLPTESLNGGAEMPGPASEGEE